MTRAKPYACWLFPLVSAFEFQIPTPTLAPDPSPSWASHISPHTLSILTTYFLSWIFDPSRGRPASALLVTWTALQVAQSSLEAPAHSALTKGLYSLSLSCRFISQLNSSTALVVDVNSSLGDGHGGLGISAFADLYKTQSFMDLTCS